MKKHFFLLLFALVASLGSLFASETQVDGIWYDFNSSSKTAAVTYQGSSYNSYSNEYTGEVVIPASVTYNNEEYNVTSIGEWAFSDCSGLTSVTIPNSVKSIGEMAFSICSGLTSVTIPNSVKSIGEWAFSSCSGLTSVTIPNSVKSIGEGAFFDCSGLTSVTIPNSVTSIGYGAFYDVPNIVYSGSATGSPWEAKSINGYVDGYLVYEDASKATLLACSTAAKGEMVIPNSVTSIRNRAFYGCKGMTSVTIGNSVTYIGNSAFDDCSSLTSVTIPNSVTYIGHYAFYFCRSLTSVTIPNSVTSIGEDAFSGCSSLTSVTIPNSVKSIGEGAFSGCSGLTSVTIPNSVTRIGSSAFVDVPNIVYSGSATGSPWGAKSINGYVDGYLVYKDASKATLLACSTAAKGEMVIPNSVASIGDKAFLNCTGLTTVTIPNSVTSIGEMAFSICSSLTSVTIPNSVKSIGEGAFSGCSGLTSVTIPNSVKSIGDRAFRDCSGLTSVTIPNSVTSIGNSAFANCSSLTSVTIPNSVTSIGEYAFEGCRGLTSVTIPNSVKSIGDYAFEYCRSLTSVTIEAETPPTLYSDVFYNTNGCPIYVPCGTLEIYQSAWSDYFSRIEYVPLEYTITGEVNNTKAGNVNLPTNTCEDTVITAVSNYGCHFVQWSDGVKDNPRKIELTQDTTFTAEFAFDRSGKCGNDSLLTWTYNPEQKLLTISGNGAFDENMAYGAEAPKEMNRLIIENGVTSIGYAAFRNCSTLESVCISSSVSNIDAYAFSGTKLTQISLANTIQQVGSKAFANCPLEKIHWDIPAQSEMVNEGITVRLDASNLGWSKVNLYAWLDDYTQLLGSWPGTRLQAEVNGFYSYTFPAEYNQINIIWNNGSSQTADIEDVTESTIYKLTGSTGTKIGWNSEELKASSPFYQCGETVTEFTLGNSVTSIPIGLCADFVKVERIDIPSSVTSIGAEAFKNCTSLKTLSLGENISSYGNEVFSGCSALDEIYNYRERPAKLGTDAFAGVDYFESTLYVLANSVDMYKSAGSDWKIFYFIEPIGASTVTTDNVSVIPSNNSVLMTWPKNDNAASYTIEITKDGEVFCRLVFNANGQLTGIAFAPSRNGTPRHAPAAKMTANGLQFTVTGLNSGTNYGYSVTTKDANEQPIASYSGEFSTTGEVPTSVDQVTSDQVQYTKILRDGEIFILRGDKIYTLQGQETIVP